MSGGPHDELQLHRVVEAAHRNAKALWRKVEGSLRISIDPDLGAIIRAPGDFQRPQTKCVDSRMGEIFRHLRRAIDVLEQITLHLYLSSGPERPPRKVLENSPGPPTSSFEKRAYTINEVSALTGISRTTIYHAIKIKELRAVKCGRRTMIRAQDLEAWIDAWPEKK